VKCREDSEADGLRPHSDTGEAGGHSHGAAGVAAVGASTSQGSPAGRLGMAWSPPVLGAVLPVSLLVAT